MRRALLWTAASFGTLALTIVACTDFKVVSQEEYDRRAGKTSAQANCGADDPSCNAAGGASNNDTSGMAGSASNDSDAGPDTPSPPICTSGESRCQGAEFETCNASGLWELSEVCASQALCDPDAGCTEIVCDVGEMRCQGQVLEGCADDQLSFEEVMTCGSGTRCSSVKGACETLDCEPGTTMCDGAELLSCDGDPPTWQSQDVCESITQCDAEAGDCGGPLCEAGTYRCTDQDLEVCAQDGQSWKLAEHCGQDFQIPLSNPSSDDNWDNITDLLDGDVGTDATRTGFGGPSSWIEFTLDGQYRVTGARLYEDHNGSHIESWKLQYYDGSEWLDAMPLLDTTGPAAGWSEASFDDVVTDRIRFYLVNQYSNYQLNEVEVFATTPVCDAQAGSCDLCQADNTACFDVGLYNCSSDGQMLELVDSCN